MSCIRHYVVFLQRKRQSLGNLSISSLRNCDGTLDNVKYKLIFIKFFRICIQSVTLQVITILRFLKQYILGCLKRRITNSERIYRYGCFTTYLVVRKHRQVQNIRINSLISLGFYEHSAPHFSILLSFWCFMFNLSEVYRYCNQQFLNSLYYHRNHKQFKHHCYTIRKSKH